MTGTEIALIITASGTFLTAAGSFAGVFISLNNRNKIEQIHVSTNSMKDELVREVRAASTASGNLAGHATGLAEGRAEERAK